MSFLNYFTRSPATIETTSMSYDVSHITELDPESIRTILGKLSVIWTGLFVGIYMTDVVLIVTLIYTVLQIGLTVYERIIKPIRALQKAARITHSIHQEK